MEPDSTIPRCLLAERRVRAIAAVHASVAVTVILGAIAWVTTVATQSHGARDLGAVIIPIVAGLAVIGGMALLLLAYFLWTYNPIAKWITTGLLAYASVLSIYVFAKYTRHFLITEVAQWRRGADSYLFHYFSGALIEILVVAWGAVVLVVLFSPGSREVFSTEFRKSIRADRAIRVPFYLSPYFVAGLVVWLLIGWALISM
jgi:hypothetical protein